MELSRSTLSWIIGGVVVSVAVVATVGGIVLKLLLKKPTKKTLLGNSIKIPIRLVVKEAVTHNTSRYTFALPTPDHILGLPVGNCVRLHKLIGGNVVTRPYTPITLDNHKGYVEFIIKTYKKDVHPDFPDGGKMTQFLDQMTIDDCVDISGPCGNILYHGEGKFETKANGGRIYEINRLSLICGGSGITPMYQLIKAILESDTDKTKISLIFSNVSEIDIILRDELEHLRDQNSEQFKLWYTLENAPNHWPYSIGYIDAKVMESHIFPAADDALALLCGPPNMIKNACIPGLKSLNYKDDMVLKF